MWKLASASYCHEDAAKLGAYVKKLLGLTAAPVVSVAL